MNVLVGAKTKAFWSRLYTGRNSIFKPSTNWYDGQAFGRHIIIFNLQYIAQAYNSRIDEINDNELNL